MLSCVLPIKYGAIRYKTRGFVRSQVRALAFYLSCLYFMNGKISTRIATPPKQNVKIFWRNLLCLW